MTVIAQRRPARAATWGWGIVVTLSALLVVNAVWLFQSVGTPAMVEGDTGMSVGELRAAFPGVADELASRGRTIAILLGGFGALALAVSITGLRTGAAWAARVLWVFVATLLAVGLHGLVGGRTDIGSFYLAWALLSALGVILSGRDARS